MHSIFRTISDHYRSKTTPVTCQWSNDIPMHRPKRWKEMNVYTYHLLSGMFTSTIRSFSQSSYSSRMEHQPSQIKFLHQTLQKILQVVRLTPIAQYWSCRDTTTFVFTSHFSLCLWKTQPGNLERLFCHSPGLKRLCFWQASLIHYHKL